MSGTIRNPIDCRVNSTFVTACHVLLSISTIRAIAPGYVRTPPEPDHRVRTLRRRSRHEDPFLANRLWTSILQTCHGPPRLIARYAAAASIRRRTNMTKVQLAARIANQASMSKTGADVAGNAYSPPSLTHLPVARSSQSPASGACRSSQARHAIATIHTQVSTSPSQHRTGYLSRPKISCATP